MPNYEDIIDRKIHEFCNMYNRYPNRLVIGSDVALNIASEAKYPVKASADPKFIIMGIEAEIDYANPNRISVGYMMD